MRTPDRPSTPEQRRAAMVPGQEQLTRVVAQAYADAVVTGGSMTLAVDVLEPLRAEMARSADPYVLDRAFSAVVARVATDDLLPVMHRMRDHYRDAVAERTRVLVLDAFREGVDGGRLAWQRVLAEALGEFSFFVMETLTSPGWLPAAVDADRERYAAAVRCARRAEWPPIGPTLDELLGLDALAPLERALLMAMKAEIAWYWQDDVRLGLREAAGMGGLAPGVARTAEVEAQALLMSGRPEDAETVLEQALAEHPRHGGLHATAFASAMALFGLEEAERRLVTGLREAPHASELYGRLLMVFAGRGKENDPRMSVLLAQADAIDPHDAYDHRLSLAAAYSTAGAGRRAVAVLEECVALHPDRLPAHVALARAQLEAEDVAAASVAVGRALRLAPDDVEALTVAASVQQAQGDLSGAADLCRRAVAQPGRRAQALLALAQVEQAAGDLDAARTHAAQALAANPWDVGVLDGVAAVARAVWERDGEDAARRLLTPPPVDPDTPDVPAAPFHLHLGRIAAKLGELPVAVRELAQATELAPRRAGWHRELATTLRTAQQWEEAAAALDRALALDGDEAADADARAGLDNARGNALFAAGDYASAVPLYASAVGRREEDAVLHYNLALALDYSAQPGRRLENLTRAVAELTRAVELAPDAVAYEVYRTTLAARAETIRRFGELVTTPAAQLPLAVEIAEDLVPVIDPAQRGAHLFDEQIPRLRAALEADLGFPVPGIRFRGAALRTGEVRVLVHGVVVATAHARPDEDCVLVPPGELMERGADGGSLTGGPDPVAGGRCTWAPPAVLDALALPGVPRLTTTGYVLRLVEEAVRRRPVALFDLETALAWVAERDDGGGEHEGPASARRRLVVARTLRALVQDGVRLGAEILAPARDAADAELAALPDTAAAVLAVPAAVARTRAAVTPVLPGAGWPDVVTVPDDVSRQLVERRHLSPDEAESLRTAVRRQAVRPVLVVEQAAARAYAQRFVADDLGLAAGRDLAAVTPAELSAASWAAGSDGEGRTRS